MSITEPRFYDLFSTLGEILTSFSEAASTCVGIFFSKQSDAPHPWQLTRSIDCDTNRIITIGYANELFQAITAFGLNEKDCFDLFNRTIQDEEFLDIIGELANNYCAMLMEQIDFTSRFGILYQSVPVLYSRGMPFLPFISGVSGKIRVEGKIYINIGFSIRKRSNN